MTREEALYKVKGYLTDIIPAENYSEVEEIIKALEQKPCEDCISRQGAIDAFGLSEKTRKYGGDHSGYNTMMLYEIQDVLESLPSEDRPTGEVNAVEIYEQAVSELDHNKITLGEYEKRIEPLKHLYLDKSTEWISVNEALPSKGQVVLAIVDKGTWDVGKFQGTAGWTDDERMWNWKKKTVKYVDYWMPKDAIPLPYREDGDTE